MTGGAPTPAKSTQTPSGGLAKGADLSPAPAASGARPTATLSDKGVVTPEAMLAIARDKVALGVDPQRLIDVAIAHRDRWARLVEEQEAAGAHLDGRASIYTGETYAEACDRWEAYRLLLVEDTRGTHGGC